MHSLPPDPSPTLPVASEGDGRPTTAADFGSPPPGYEILAELGRGGMGVVYKARHLALNRIVALKMILSGSHAGPTELQRFRTEAEAIARLDHPNIVHVYDVGEHEGKPFFSMEYCPGGSLEAKLAGTPLPPPLAAALVETLARAMHAAHAHNVLHRDLKPANILLTAEATPKVTDFGLAKKLDEVSQTQSGSVLGTPSYMAPEQAGGQTKDLGPACDVYALGAILYEALSGRPPFRAASAMDTLMHVLRDEPVPVRQLQPKVPRDLETVCLKCLRKEPAKRYASAGDLADDLHRFLAGDPIKARPVGGAERLWRWCRRNPAVAALTAAAVLLLVAVAAVASAGYVQTAAALTLVEQQKQEAVGQRDAANRHLYRSLVGEARALRLARREGYRRQCWELLGEALRLDIPDPDPAALRQEAVRCLGDWVGMTPTTWTDLPPVVDQTAMAVHPDGVHVATGWFTGDIRLSRLDTGQETARLAGHTSTVLALQFTPRGDRLVSAEAGGVLKLWQRDEAGSWREVRSVVPPLKGNHRWLAIAPDEGVVFVGTYGATAIATWDLATGALGEGVKGGKGEALYGPHLSADGKRLVAGYHRSAPAPYEGALIWDAATRQLVQTVGSNQGHATTLAKLSPDGKLLVLNAGDQGLLLFDTKEYRQQALFRCDTVEKAVFTPDSRLLIFNTMTGVLYVWDVSASGTAPVRLADAEGTRRGLAVSADGRRLITAGPRALRVRQLGDTEEKRFLAGHVGGVTTVVFSPDGRRLATGGKDGKATLWDIDAGRPERSLPPFPAAVQTVAFHPDGRVLATGDYAAGIRFWDANTGDSVAAILDHPLGNHIYKVAFSPDGRSFAATGKGLAVWSVTWDGPRPAFKPVTTQKGSRSTFLSISADCRLLAWVNYDRRCQLWDLERGRALPSPDAWLLSGWHNMAALPDGQRIAFVSHAGTVEIWDARGRTKTAELGQPQEHGSYHVALAPDGRLLATDAVPTAVTLWDLAAGKRYLNLPPESGPIWSIDWSRDGRQLAVGLADGGLAVWDLGRVEKQLQDAGF